jgi:hypothetical protein
MDLTPLHEALLELGLEDLIPLPEIRATPEVRNLGKDYQHFDKISTALADLLRAGRIQVWAGRWPDEPTLVSNDVAETILRDERRYSFDAEADGLERVYITNVENIRA